MRKCFEPKNVEHNDVTFCTSIRKRPKRIGAYTTRGQIPFASLGVAVVSITLLQVEVNITRSPALQTPVAA